jgi:pimeloyl-ACP methyl ester carboxylesterase
VGGSEVVENYPHVEPRGKFTLPREESLASGKKIALIGHSAGGWISRVYVSNRNYGGKVYDGQRYVHSLVTLGTPHASAPGPAFEGIKWCNQEPTIPVRALAVGGTGFKGDEWGALTLGAYSFCCTDGTDGSTYTGDGMTPIQSALALPGAEQMTLEGVTHFCWSEVFGGSWVAPELTEDHKAGRPWYGDEDTIAKWADWIVK